MIWMLTREDGIFAGIPEKAGENVKQMISDLFSQVSPSIAADLPRGVDIAHRLGPRSAAERSSRRIIVLFSLRSQRDKVWRDQGHVQDCILGVAKGGGKSRMRGGN